MNWGPGDHRGEAVTGKIAASTEVAHALYECTPLGEQRLIAKHQFVGSEKEILDLASRHIAELWGQEPKNFNFRKTRAIAQRINDHIYFTLAYREDFRTNQDRHPSTAVGTRAYILIVKADGKKTTEHETVKALVGYAPRLLRSYIAQDRYFLVQLSTQFPNPRNIIPQPGQIAFETGHEKIKLLDDIVVARETQTFLGAERDLEFSDEAPQHESGRHTPATDALLPSLAAYSRLTDYLAGARIPADAPEGITQAILFVRAQIDAFAAYTQNPTQKPEAVPPLFARLYQAHDGATKDLQKHIGALRADYAEATSILFTIAERLERSVGEKT